MWLASCTLKGVLDADLWRSTNNERRVSSAAAKTGASHSPALLDDARLATTQHGSNTHMLVCARHMPPLQGLAKPPK